MNEKENGAHQSKHINKKPKSPLRMFSRGGSTEVRAEPTYIKKRVTMEPSCVNAFLPPSTTHFLPPSLPPMLSATLGRERNSRSPSAFPGGPIPPLRVWLHISTSPTYPTPSSALSSAPSSALSSAPASSSLAPQPPTYIHTYRRWLHSDGFGSLRGAAAATAPQQKKKCGNTRIHKHTHTYIHTYTHTYTPHDCVDTRRFNEVQQQQQQHKSPSSSAATHDDSRRIRADHVRWRWRRSTHAWLAGSAAMRTNVSSPAKQ
eukprot:GHVU01230238.1.p1 GENE.GHVU01230238.1~~GHVU01230238.1.p1  ORF type:complete len:260 (+),score=45.33 GHVU01230238.1:678-1457(+)